MVVVVAEQELGLVDRMVVVEQELELAGRMVVVALVRVLVLVLVDHKIVVDHKEQAVVAKLEEQNQVENKVTIVEQEEQADHIQVDHKTLVAVMEVELVVVRMAVVVVRMLVAEQEQPVARMLVVR
ncbi:unnamed protein product [[Candida] boidinii]|nr:unnamed protein product [[Candida] boidinii]